MKKQNYAIKALSLALLITSSALFHSVALHAKDNVEVAIQVFKQHINNPNPDMHWSDLMHVIHKLLESTPYKAGGDGFKKLEHEKRDNVAGPLLLLAVNKLKNEHMTQAMNEVRKKVATAELARRFNASWSVPRLSPEKLDELIKHLKHQP